MGSELYLPQQGPYLCPALPPDAPRDAVLSSFRDSRTRLMVVIQCTVDSEPPAEMVLSHNGKVLAASHERHSSESGTGHIQVARNALRLQVQDVTLGDGNTYVCTARNTLGSISTTQRLLMETGEWDRGEEGARFGILVLWGWISGEGLLT